MLKNSKNAFLEDEKMNDVSRVFLQILYEEMSEGRLEFDLGLAVRTKVYSLPEPPSLEEMEELLRTFLPQGKSLGLLEKLKARVHELENERENEGIGKK